MARRPTEEAPELTDAQLAELRPAREVHSPEEFAALTAVRRRGRPVAVAKKVPVTMRLDAELVQALKATGRNWQTRVNTTLSEQYGVTIRADKKLRKAGAKGTAKGAAKAKGLRKRGAETVEDGAAKVA